MKTFKSFSGKWGLNIPWRHFEGGGERLKTTVYMSTKQSIPYVKLVNRLSVEISRPSSPIHTFYFLPPPKSPPPPQKTPETKQPKATFISPSPIIHYPLIPCHNSTSLFPPTPTLLSLLLPPPQFLEKPQHDEHLSVLFFFPPLTVFSNSYSS